MKGESESVVELNAAELVKTLWVWFYAQFYHKEKTPNEGGDRVAGGGGSEGWGGGGDREGREGGRQARGDRVGLEEQGEGSREWVREGWGERAGRGKEVGSG